MKIKYYLKKCEEFAICSEIGDDDGEGRSIGIENAKGRYTLFQIIVRGSGRMAKVYDSNYVIGSADKNNFVDMKQYLGHHTIFESFEPFHMYGFNTLDLQQDWEGRLVDGSFNGDDKSWLVVFKGEPIINSKSLREMDYAKLENKIYDVQLNDAIVGVFTKV